MTQTIFKETSTLVCHIFWPAKPLSWVGLQNFTITTNLYNLQVRTSPHLYAPSAKESITHKPSFKCSTCSKESCIPLSLEPPTSLLFSTPSAKVFVSSKPSSTSQVRRSLAISPNTLGGTTLKLHSLHKRTPLSQQSLLFLAPLPQMFRLSHTHSQHLESLQISLNTMSNLSRTMISHWFTCEPPRNTS